MRGLTIALMLSVLAALESPAGGVDTARSESNADASAPPTAPAAADLYPIKRHIRYRFTLQNSEAHVLEHASLIAYAPVKRTSTQRVDGLAATVTPTIQLDASGNQILDFHFDPLAPYATRVVTVEAQLSLTDKPVPDQLPALLQAAYTRSERYIESEDPHIAAIAKDLKASNALQTARNLYQFVRRTLRSLPYTPEDRGALEALSRKAGDCTEFAYLYVALARASGIPARALGGFVMPESGVLDPRDYHNWAEFYADGAWQLADPQRGRFMSQASHYIAMRIISTAFPNQVGSSHRYSVTGQGLRVTMN
jgi:hypothetical protein